MRAWGGSRHSEQIYKAFKHGQTISSRTDTKVYFNGVAEVVHSFEGSRWFASGKLDFWHHGARILAVDFDRDMVTDFGYAGYGMTTNANLQGWLHQLRRMAFIGTLCLGPDAWALDWTMSSRYNPESRVLRQAKMTTGERLNLKYRMGAPWVVQIDGSPWFAGRKYDLAAGENAARVFGEIFEGSNYKWFTADWVDGQWTKRFIDAEAEKRWNAWRKRQEKG